MYNKIFTKILDSSIWLETDSTRIVWLTLIAAMDEDGFAQFASVPNLAHRARVTVTAAEEAVTCLESPDPNSSDPDNDGRRIERVPGGWMVLNSQKYRDIVTRAMTQEKTRQRVARFRARHREPGCNAPLRRSNDGVTPSEAYSEAESDTPLPPKPPETPAAPARGGVGSQTGVSKCQHQLRAEKLFNKRPATAWDPSESRAWKNARAAVMSTHEEDWLLLEWFYSLPDDPRQPLYRRKALAQLLNNWGGEIERARATKATYRPAEQLSLPASNLR